MKPSSNKMVASSHIHIQKGRGMTGIFHYDDLTFGAFPKYALKISRFSNKIKNISVHYPRFIGRIAQIIDSGDAEFINHRRRFSVREEEANSTKKEEGCKRFAIRTWNQSKQPNFFNLREAISDLSSLQNRQITAMLSIAVNDNLRTKLDNANFRKSTKENFIILLTELVRRLGVRGVDIDKLADGVINNGIGEINNIHSAIYSIARNRFNKRKYSTEESFFDNFVKSKEIEHQSRFKDRLQT